MKVELAKFVVELKLQFVIISMWRSPTNLEMMVNKEMTPLWNYEVRSRACPQSS